MNKLTYYTDGGCEPNPGNGTWAVICISPYIELSGAEPNTTSNRMELTAIINAINHASNIKSDIPIEIFSDSQYCVKGFNDWMHGWVRKNWMKKDEPVKNVDLWKTLWELRRPNIKLTWVRGHDGNEFNEQCDQLVRYEYEKTFGGQMQH